MSTVQSSELVREPISDVQQRRNVLLARIYMCAAVALWAAIEVVGAGTLGGYSGLEVVWVRYGTHLLFMFALFVPRRRTGFVRTSRPWLQIVRSSMMLGMPICFLLAAQRMDPQDALAVFWISPLIVMALAQVILRERITLVQWSLAGIAFVGVMLIEQPDQDALRRPVVLAVGMALCFGLYLVMTRALRGEAMSTNLFYTAAGVFVPLSLALPLFWRQPDSASLLTMVAIGLLGYATLALMDLALHMAPASAVAPFAFIQPICFVLVGLVVGRHTGLLALIGIAAVLASLVCLAAIDRLRAGAAPPPDAAPSLAQLPARTATSETQVTDD